MKPFGICSRPVFSNALRALQSYSNTCVTATFAGNQNVLKNTQLRSKPSERPVISIRNGIRLFASKRPVSRLVLVTPFDSMANVAQSHYPWLPVRWLLQDRYDQASYLAKYDGPLLIVRAGRDDVVPAAEIVHGRGRLLHVTFDDAFRSIDAALPALERLGVPATVFACSDLADEGLPLDVPELAADVAAHPDELATHPWERLRELAGRGVEIGSHTCSHPHLPRLGDDELDRELQESRARLEDVNDVFAKMHKGQIEGRIVLDLAA